MRPRINDQDHGASMVLAVALMLVYSWLSLGIRLFTRWPKDFRSIPAEDIILIVAAIFSIGYTVCICDAVSSGYGRHENDLTQGDIGSLKKALLTCYLFYFLTKGLADTAYAMFLHGMSEVRFRRLAIKIVCGIIGTFALAGFIASAVAIATVEPLAKDTWIVLGAVEAAVLVTLFLLNVWMFWKLQMPARRKLTTTLWFSLALLLVALIVGRLVYTPSQLFRPNFTFNTIGLFILITVDMHFAIINAAYPNLLAFVSKASTGFMNTTPGGKSYGKSYGQHSAHSANRENTAVSTEPRLRNDATARITTSARHNLDPDDISLESFNSRRIMVQKSVAVDYPSNDKWEDRTEHLD